MLLGLQPFARTENYENFPYNVNNQREKTYNDIISSITVDGPAAGGFGRLLQCLILAARFYGRSDRYGSVARRLRCVPVIRASVPTAARLVRDLIAVVNNLHFVIVLVWHIFFIDIRTFIVSGQAHILIKRFILAFNWFKRFQAHYLAYLTVPAVAPNLIALAIVFFLKFGLIVRFLNFL